MSKERMASRTSVSSPLVISCGWCLSPTGAFEVLLVELPVIGTCFSSLRGVVSTWCHLCSISTWTTEFLRSVRWLSISCVSLGWSISILACSWDTLWGIFEGGSDAVLVLTVPVWWRRSWHTCSLTTSSSSHCDGLLVWLVEVIEMGEVETEDREDVELITKVSALFLKGWWLSLPRPGRNSTQSMVFDRPSLLGFLRWSVWGAESVMSLGDFWVSIAELLDCEELGGGWIKFSSTFDLLRSSGRELCERTYWIINQ